MVTIMTVSYTTSIFAVGSLTDRLTWLYRRIRDPVAAETKKVRGLKVCLAPSTFTQAHNILLAKVVYLCAIIMIVSDF